jgi:hypothetical protein
LPSCTGRILKETNPDKYAKTAYSIDMGIGGQKEKCPWMIQEGKIEQNGLKTRKRFMSASWTKP